MLIELTELRIKSNTETHYYVTHTHTPYSVLRHHYYRWAFWQQAVTRVSLVISFDLRHSPHYYTDVAPTMSHIHRWGEVRGFVCEYVCKVVVCWGEGTMSREGGGDIISPDTGSSWVSQQKWSEERGRFEPCEKVVKRANVLSEALLISVCGIDCLATCHPAFYSNIYTCALDTVR